MVSYGRLGEHTMLGYFAGGPRDDMSMETHLFIVVLLFNLKEEAPEGGTKDVHVCVVRKNGSNGTARSTGGATSSSAYEYRPHKVALMTPTEETPTRF